MDQSHQEAVSAAFELSGDHADPTLQPRPSAPLVLHLSLHDLLHHHPSEQSPEDYLQKTPPHLQNARKQATKSKGKCEVSLEEDNVNGRYSAG